MSERPEEYDVQVLHDRLEITDVIHAYAYGVDDQRADAVADLFAEDGVFRAYDRPKGLARGRAEVAALLERLLATFRATSHHVSGTRIAFMSSDRAAATTMLYAWHRFVDERPDGHLWGRYHDELVREGARWRFARRELRVTAHRNFEFPWLPAGSGCGHTDGDVPFNQPNTW